MAALNGETDVLSEKHFKGAFPKVWVVNDYTKYSLSNAEKQGSSNAESKDRKMLEASTVKC